MTVPVPVPKALPIIHQNTGDTNGFDRCTKKLLKFFGRHSNPRNAIGMFKVLAI